MKSFHVFPFIIAVLIISFNGCGKSENKAPSVPVLEKSSSMSGEKKESEEMRKNKTADGSLEPLIAAPMKESGGRLLEYNAKLVFQNDDFLKAREDLIKIISRYGYLRSGSTDISGSSSILTVSASVHSKDLYAFLLDASSVGKLVIENIWANDHTEAMALAERKISREDLRILRKAKSQAGLSPAAKNWVDIEESIKASEDSLDNAEHGKWKVKDAVAWAKIEIEVSPVSIIKIPSYKKALFGSVNMVLYLLYALLYMLPVLIIISLIWWKRSVLFNLFRRKK